MHGEDFAALVLSVLLILLSWTVAGLVRRKKCFGQFTDTAARKIVHIGVSNFAFVYLYLFKSWVLPVTGLLVFALINFFIEKHDRALSDRVADGGRRSWGTVEYPLVIALLIVLVRLGTGTKEAVACALLGMGYGDGLAPVTGRIIRSPHVPFSREKTLAGSLTVFFCVFTVCLAVGRASVPCSLLCSFAAMLGEAYTPFNLDNITVPVVVFLFTGVLHVCV